VWWNIEPLVPNMALIVQSWRWGGVPGGLVRERVVEL